VFPILVKKVKKSNARKSNGGFDRLSNHKLANIHGNQFSDIGTPRWLSLSKRPFYLKKHLKTISKGYLIPKLVVEKYWDDEN